MNFEYKRDIFYEPKIYSLKEFKKDAIKNSSKIILEQKYKNNNKNWARREPTDKSLEWIIKDSSIKIVHRMERPGSKEHFQIVFIKNWYFAWCDIPLNKKDYFINKYNLKIQ